MRESLFHKPDGTILNRVTDLVHHKNHWDHNHVDQISPSWNSFLFDLSPDTLQPSVRSLDFDNPLIYVILHWSFSQHSLRLDILQIFIFELFFDYVAKPLFNITSMWHLSLCGWVLPSHPPFKSTFMSSSLGLRYIASLWNKGILKILMSILEIKRQMQCALVNFYYYYYY